MFAFYDFCAGLILEIDVENICRNEIKFFTLHPQTERIMVFEVCKVLGGVVKKIF